jgi:hypothetical protein
MMYSGQTWWVDSFDLGRLSDYDFEVLCKDLFEDLLDVPLEVFARGREPGIDLRHVAAVPTEPSGATPDD